MVCVVGFTDKENSELLLPPPLELPTVRRGEITQPVANKHRIARKNAGLRIGCSFRLMASLPRLVWCWQAVVPEDWIMVACASVDRKGGRIGKELTDFVKPM
jgi:hypothetical protein